MEMNNKHSLLKIKINKVAIAAFIMLIIYLQPSNFINLVPGSFVTILRGFQAALFFLTLFVFIRSKTRITGQLALIISYYILVYGISILIKSSTPKLAEVFSSSVLCLFIAIEYSRNRKALFAGFSEYYLVMAIIEMLLVLALKPAPMAGMVLFSNRNHVIRFFLPGVFFVLMDSKHREDRYLTVWSVLYIALVTMLVFYGKSATGIVGLVTLLVYIMIFRNREVPKFLELKYIVIYSMLIFAGIYFLGIQKYFEHFIIALDRDTTFTGRTYIWDSAVAVIKKNLFFGVGAYSTYAAFLNGHMHAHQYWLQNLLTGGIIGTGLIFFVYLNASNSLRDTSKIEGTSILCATITAFLVIGIDEALNRTEMLIPLLFIAGVYRIYDGRANVALRSRKTRKIAFSKRKV